MSHSTRALEALQRLGSPYYPSTAAQLRQAPAHVYLVTNGPHVLQIGQGRLERLRSCMRGSLAGRHAKAWICAIAEVAFERPNTYAVLDFASSYEASDAERQLHQQFGIGTNRDAATLIEGLGTASGTASLAAVNAWLWTRVRDSSRYATLSPVEKAMAEELHDLITFGDVRIERSGGWQRSSRGDILEGNVLMNAGKSYLIPVFEKLTDGYLRYGIHRPTDQAFAEASQGYEYAPRQAPFRIQIPMELRTRR